MGSNTMPQASKGYHTKLITQTDHTKAITQKDHRAQAQH
jgi:hypothetical protein